MIRSLLRRILTARHTHSGSTPPATTDHQHAGIIHHGEYIYRDNHGTTWHVQHSPDGETRTRLTPARTEGDDE